MGGSLDMVRAILKEEGFAGLFAGNLHTHRRDFMLSTGRDGNVHCAVDVSVSSCAKPRHSCQLKPSSECLSLSSYIGLKWTQFYSWRVREETVENLG